MFHSPDFIRGGGKFILGNSYPPPPDFLRGGYAHTRKLIPPFPGFPEGGYVHTRKLITDHQEIHTPPSRKSIPPSPSFPGGGYGYPIPGGGVWPSWNSTIKKKI